MFRIFLSQTPCVICRDFRSEFNTVLAFALISHSRVYTKGCTQITTFWELTPQSNRRKFKPRVSGQPDQPPTESSLQVGQRPLLTEEFATMRRSPSPLRATSSPSARLGAETAISPHAHRVPETGLGALWDTQRPKRSSPMTWFQRDMDLATAKPRNPNFLRRKYELSNKLL